MPAISISISISISILTYFSPFWFLYPRIGELILIFSFIFIIFFIQSAARFSTAVSSSAYNDYFFIHAEQNGR